MIERDRTGMCGQIPQVAVSPVVSRPMSSTWAHNSAGFYWAINKIDMDAYFVAGLIAELPASSNKGRQPFRSNMCIEQSLIGVCKLTLEGGEVEFIEVFRSSILAKLVPMIRIARKTENGIGECLGFKLAKLGS